jgi:glycine/serine hydroxymethyltransferase
MKEKEVKKIAGWILSVIDHVKGEKLPGEKEKRVEFIKSFRARLSRDKFLAGIASEVKALCKKFPTP